MCLTYVCDATTMTDGPIDYAAIGDGAGWNLWRADPTLRRHAARQYPVHEFEWAEAQLDEWGGIVGSPIAQNSADVDRHGPELHTHDRNGEIQNEVEYHPKQLENERLTYEHGVVADAFEPPEDRDEPLGMTHHLLQTGMLAAADPGFACPVAMTGGVALVFDRFRSVSPDPDLLEPYWEGVTARDYETLTEGAMFLTEKQGGSDVGAIETTAEPTDETGVYELTGEKWFCSNIDAEATLVLARRPDAPDGTRGLSMFLVPHTRRDGSLNEQVYRRLKDKLGTISVPTGEVVLDGAEGYLVGEPEQGFHQMTEMLNLERLHNAFSSVGVVSRALLESKAHAATREAFGETIDRYPLLRRDLADMTVDHEAATAFVFAAARSLDRRREAPKDSQQRRRAYQLMRILVPIAKYRLGKLAVETASEACEVLGGNGYVSGFTTERLLRDAQVLPIWEGTSNILSLDVLRALDREDAHEALLPHVRETLSEASHEALGDDVERVEAAFEDVQHALGSLATADERRAQYEAKEFAGLVYDVVAAAHLLAHAQYRLDTADDARESLVARRFARRRFRHSSTRGIGDEDTLADDHYDAIARYRPVEPDTVL